MYLILCKLILCSQLSRMYRLLTTCYFDEGADVDCCTTSARRALDLDECTESHLLLVRCLAVADKAELLANELQVVQLYTPLLH